MPICPFCQATLSKANVRKRRCPKCRRKLSRKQAAGQAKPTATDQTVADAPRPEKPDDTTAADNDRRLAETIESASVPGPSSSGDEAPPAEGDDRQTTDDRELAQTIEASTQPVLPKDSEKEGKKTTDDRQLAQTLEVDGISALGDKGSPTTDDRQLAKTMEAAGQPVDPGAGTADDHHLAKTLESGQPTPGAIEQISLLWSGTSFSETAPSTSIKAKQGSSRNESDLVIQSQSLRKAKEESTTGADYLLLDQLGEGGMGVVYAARQSAIDRTVAIKMLKSTAAGDRDERGKFLSEAVVTGDLEHPNIVPIYNLGKSESGALFYSMKRVKGTPWNVVLVRKTHTENLDILMRVADAVAFAHSRRVVHRDLKPENVMLGDFGEVLLMDWGLAVSLRASRGTIGMGGTPAYMAPEMASGPVDRIGTASDVYLLGAILYEILTGRPPHTGRNVVQCLLAAAKNEIRPTEVTGELMDVARKAMATKRRDRYAGVGEFQDAIRAYQSHSESILLSTRAEEDLQRAEKNDDYETYSRALFGFQEAVELWDGNAKAKSGVSRAAMAYATSALNKSDFDLGLSLLDTEDSDHAELIAQLREAQRERDARQQRLKAAKWIGAVLVLTVLVVVTVAFFLIRAEAERARTAEGVAEDRRIEAEDQKGIAEGQRAIAETEKAAAVEARKDAEIAQGKAEDAQKVAETAEQVAIDARKQEEYGAYIARIGLAAAKIDENAFDGAIALLNACPGYLRNWEWGRLMHLCTQEIRTFNGKQPLDAMALSADGSRLAIGGWGGTVRLFEVASGQALPPLDVGAEHVFALAFSPNGKQLTVGSNDRDGYVKIFDVATGKLAQTLTGHLDAVLSVAYSRDARQLLTGSYDNTARLFDLADGSSKVFHGHDWWVHSAAFSPDEKRIVTASQDGFAIVWSVETGEPGPPFRGHSGPVYVAAFSPDGQYVATAGYDNRVLLWKPADVKDFDFDTLFADTEPAALIFDAFDGHTAAVRTVGFSADGTLLLSGGNDNTVRIWGVQTHQPIKTLRGHAGRVRACRFLPDGEGILSAAHDHHAKLWNVAGYEEVRVFGGRVLHGHEDAVYSAAFSRDGRQVVSASRDRTARTWDFATGRPIRHFREGHKFLASAALFFPDGKTILTAAGDNTTRIWDLTTGTQLLLLDGTGSKAAATLFHDGTRILTGSDRKTAQLWDARNGQLLQTLEGHTEEVSAVAVSPQDKWLLTADAKGDCLLFNARTAELKWRSETHSRGVTAAAFPPNGQRVLTASLDNTVGQWDVETGEELTDAILKHPNAVTGLAVSRDGQHALTACADKTIRLWNVDDGRLIRPLVTTEQMVTGLAFSPDGRRALITTADDVVSVVDVAAEPETAVAARPLIDLSGDRGKAWTARFAPDGNRILSAGGNDARLWDADGTELMRFAPHGAVASANFSPDGKRVITGSWDGSARIWNVETGLAELKLEGGHTGFVTDAVFSPDGATALTASDDATVRLWDAATGELLRTFGDHTAAVHCVAFSAGGKHVLTASADRTARIFNVETGDEVHVLTGHGQAVLHAAFSADGSKVITAGEDNTARLWNALDGRPIGIALQGHTSAVTSAAFSPDGTRAITGSQDHTAKIWDTSTGKEILTLKAHTQEVTTVAFSPDGQSALTGSRDGTLILWLAAEWRKPAK